MMKSPMKVPVLLFVATEKYSARSPFCDLAVWTSSPLPAATISVAVMQTSTVLRMNVDFSKSHPPFHLGTCFIAPLLGAPPKQPYQALRERRAYENEWQGHGSSSIKI